MEDFSCYLGSWIALRLQNDSKWIGILKDVDWEKSKLFLVKAHEMVLTGGETEPRLLPFGSKVFSGADIEDMTMLMPENLPPQLRSAGPKPSPIHHAAGPATSPSPTPRTPTRNSIQDNATQSPCEDPDMDAQKARQAALMAIQTPRRASSQVVHQLADKEMRSPKHTNHSASAASQAEFRTPEKKTEAAFAPAPGPASHHTPGPAKAAEQLLQPTQPLCALEEVLAKAPSHSAPQHPTPLAPTLSVPLPPLPYTPRASKKLNAEEMAACRHMIAQLAGLNLPIPGCNTVPSPPVPSMASGPLPTTLPVDNPLLTGPSLGLPQAPLPAASLSGMGMLPGAHSLLQQGQLFQQYQQALQMQQLQQQMYQQQPCLLPPSGASTAYPPVDALFSALQQGWGMPPSTSPLGSQNQAALHQSLSGGGVPSSQPMPPSFPPVLAGGAGNLSPLSFSPMMQKNRSSEMRESPLSVYSPSVFSHNNNGTVYSRGSLNLQGDHLHRASAKTPEHESMWQDGRQDVMQETKPNARGSRHSLSSAHAESRTSHASLLTRQARQLLSLDDYVREQVKQAQEQFDGRHSEDDSLRDQKAVDEAVSWLLDIELSLEDSLKKLWEWVGLGFVSFAEFDSLKAELVASEERELVEVESPTMAGRPTSTEASSRRKCARERSLSAASASEAHHSPTKPPTTPRLPSSVKAAPKNSPSKSPAQVQAQSRGKGDTKEASPQPLTPHKSRVQLPLSAQPSPLKPGSGGINGGSPGNHLGDAVAQIHIINNKRGSEADPSSKVNSPRVNSRRSTKTNSTAPTFPTSSRISLVDLADLSRTQPSAPRSRILKSMPPMMPSSSIEGSCSLALTINSYTDMGLTKTIAQGLHECGVRTLTSQQTLLLAELQHLMKASTELSPPPEEISTPSPTASGEMAPSLQVTCFKTPSGPGTSATVCAHLLQQALLFSSPPESWAAPEYPASGLGELSLHPLAMVLCPTRTEAEDMGDMARALAFHSGVPVHTAVGGTRMAQQRVDADGLCQVSLRSLLVGTTGRVLDMLRRGRLDVSGVRVIVLMESTALAGTSDFQEQAKLLMQKLAPSIQQVVMLTPTDLLPTMINVYENVLKAAIAAHGDRLPPSPMASTISLTNGSSMGDSRLSQTFNPFQPTSSLLSHPPNNRLASQSALGFSHPATPNHSPCAITSPPLRPSSLTRLNPNARAFGFTPSGSESPPPAPTTPTPLPSTSTLSPTGATTAPSQTTTPLVALTLLFLGDPERPLSVLLHPVEPTHTLRDTTDLDQEALVFLSLSLTEDDFAPVRVDLLAAAPAQRYPPVVRKPLHLSAPSAAALPPAGQPEAAGGKLQPAGPLTAAPLGQLGDSLAIDSVAVSVTSSGNAERPVSVAVVACH
eukprot:gene6078-2679_t